MHTNFVLLCVPKRGKLRSLKVLSLPCLKVDDLGLKRRRRVVARRSCGAAAEKFWERERMWANRFLCSSGAHSNWSTLFVDHFFTEVQNISSVRKEFGI